MVKNLKKCLLAGLIVFVLGGVNVNAESFNVQNEKGLRDAILKAKSNDTIVLDSNISLNSNLNIDKSINIDLNKKTVVVSGNSSSIVIGKKDVKSKKERTFNLIKFKFKKEHKFNYDDDMKVTIQNGTIVHSNGLSGKNGVKNSWFDYCGKDGVTPIDTIRLESGKLSLNNANVYGGNGGNGGNGAPQASVHFVGGGGIGGRGGHAGNGGNAINILRKECTLELGKDVSLRAGKAGKVGKNSAANSNYWVYKPFELKVSSKAKAGQKVNKDFENN